MPLRDILPGSGPSNNSYSAIIDMVVQSFQVKVETEQRYVEILMNYKYLQDKFIIHFFFKYLNCYANILEHEL